MEYVRRIVDDEIDRKKDAFNAINIVGPKGCGKTRTAKERCNTIIEFQDEEKRGGYLEVADTSPGLFLKNQKPILFDEWQDIWNSENCRNVSVKDKAENSYNNHMGRIICIEQPFHPLPFSALSVVFG